MFCCVRAKRQRPTCQRGTRSGCERSSVRRAVLAHIFSGSCCSINLHRCLVRVCVRRRAGEHLPDRHQPGKCQYVFAGGTPVTTLAGRVSSSHAPRRAAACAHAAAARLPPRIHLVRTPHASKWPCARVAAPRHVLTTLVQHWSPSLQHWPTTLAPRHPKRTETSPERPARQRRGVSWQVTRGEALCLHSAGSGARSQGCFQTWQNSAPRQQQHNVPTRAGMRFRAPEARTERRLPLTSPARAGWLEARRTAPFWVRSAPSKAARTCAPASAEHVFPRACVRARDS